jgi:hypothetical protein
MTAGASKARFRRPTLTWRTMPAASIRFIASLVAWKLHPMSFCGPGDRDDRGTGQGGQ